MIRRLALLVSTIALGLATRRFPGAFPAFVAQYGGDTLWAAMVFWLVALIRPQATSIHLAALAMTIAFAVEFSQLYHAPWLDALRATPLGALALGQGFLWTDLVCYAAGATLAAGVDALIVRRGTRSSSDASQANH
jgi:hypothetical protein